MTDASALAGRVQAALDRMDDVFWTSENTIAEIWAELLSNEGLRIALHRALTPVTEWVPLEPWKVTDGRVLVSSTVIGPLDYDLIGVDGVVFDVKGTLDFDPPYATKLGLPRGQTYRYEITQPLGDVLPWFSPLVVQDAEIT